MYRKPMSSEEVLSAGDEGVPITDAHASGRRDPIYAYGCGRPSCQHESGHECVDVRAHGCA